jgi:hypothetical protein
MFLQKDIFVFYMIYVGLGNRIHIFNDFLFGSFVIIDRLEPVGLYPHQVWINKYLSNKPDQDRRTCQAVQRVGLACYFRLILNERPGF